jgi:hypothetical protein
MIVAVSQEGQLCNRLFHFSHLISHAINSGDRLWYPFISEYLHYFPNLNRKTLDDLQINVYSNGLIRSMLPRLASIFSKYYQDPFFLTYIKSGDEIIDLSIKTQEIHKNNLLLLDGWLFRDKNYYLSNAPLIRELFQFKKEINDEALRVVSNIKNNSDICMVGVHIRRGDYAQWQAGRYYFNDETYLTAINQISSLLNDQGKKAIFILCSNEAISPASPLLEYPHITLHQKTAIEDLCLLSKCDLLIGPPSTFTIWASFFGSKPLCYLEIKDQIIKLQQFLVRHC